MAFDAEKLEWFRYPMLKKYSCILYHFFQLFDLEIWVRGHSMSFKLVPFKTLDAVSYLPCIVTTAVSLTAYQIFSVKV